MTTCDEFHDVLCEWNKETEIVIKCRKLSSQPLCEPHVGALRRENQLGRRSLTGDFSGEGCRPDRPSRFLEHTPREPARLL